MAKENCACPSLKEAEQTKLERMPTEKKGCDDDENVCPFSSKGRLFRKSKGAVRLGAKVSCRLMCFLRESETNAHAQSVTNLKIWDPVFTHSGEIWDPLFPYSGEIWDPMSKAASFDESINNCGI